MATEFDVPPSNTLRAGDILWPRHPQARALRTGWARGQGLGLPDLLVDLKSKVGLPADLGTVVSLWSIVRPKTLPGPLADAVEKLLDPLVDLYLCMLGSLGAAQASQADGGQEEAPEFAAKWPAIGALLGKLRTDPSQATFFGLYVGHCALVDVSPSGEIWVVESSYRAGGVHMLPYDHWLEVRRARGAQVWHGRVRWPDGVEGPRRMLAEAHALRQRRVPYAIFDPSPGGLFAPLGDLRRLYCSELVWHCAQKAGKLDLDTRDFKWLPVLGPQALTESAHVVMLNQPGGQAY